MGSDALSPESSISKNPKRKVQETQFPGRGPGDGVPWRSSLLRTKGKHEKKDTASLNGRHDRFRLFGTWPAARTNWKRPALRARRAALRRNGSRYSPPGLDEHPAGGMAVHRRMCVYDARRVCGRGHHARHGHDGVHRLDAHVYAFRHRSARRADRQPAARQQPAQRRAVQPALRVRDGRLGRAGRVHRV